MESTRNKCACVSNINNNNNSALLSSMILCNAIMVAEICVYADWHILYARTHRPYSISTEKWSKLYQNINPINEFIQHRKLSWEQSNQHTNQSHPFAIVEAHEDDDDDDDNNNNVDDCEPNTPTTNNDGKTYSLSVSIVIEWRRQIDPSQHTIQRAWIQDRRKHKKKVYAD